MAVNLEAELKKQRDNFFEADCLVDTLAGYIENANDAMKKDIGMNGRNKARKLLDEALQHIQEYSDES